MSIRNAMQIMKPSLTHSMPCQTTRYTIFSVFSTSRYGASSSAVTTPPFDDIYCPIWKFNPKEIWGTKWNSFYWQIDYNKVTSKYRKAMEIIYLFNMRESTSQTFFPTLTHIKNANDPNNRFYSTLDLRKKRSLDRKELVTNPQM